MGLKSALRKLTPSWVLHAYHWSLAKLAAAWYGHPSEKLIVIGVTGTKGKSTTSNLIAQFLEMTGHRVGLTSTATMKVADKEWLNDMKMTMPGRFTLQRLLRDMVNAGCDYAVVETSSEGLAQHRHIGIHYDIAVFTNLSPEHIESHGSYEAYRAAKGKLFEHLKNSPVKVINGMSVQKRAIFNRDDKESKFFEAFNAAESWWFGLTQDGEESNGRILIASITSFTSEGLALSCRGHEFRVPLIGKINAYNIMAAITALVARGIFFEHLIAEAPHLKPVPGRQEFITEGQPFTVVVDYAYEPTGIAELYSLLAVVPHDRVIHVLGPTGGGRDSWRRPVLGEIAAHHADVVIITTDDPYDEDPSLLAEAMLTGARDVQAQGRMVEVEKIIDRRAAIHEAFARAKPHDLVLITGKGAEQKMALANGRYIPWDDREVAREELHRLS